MPQVADEENQASQPSDSAPVNVLSLWKKFHFSGRVIMCSVLFGLGLVLIGGLLFVINVDDNSSDSGSKVDKDSKNAVDDVGAKPPSKYVGPVVMGIGGFIVIVGVIMCLFETQVCRKKTGDSSPLISEKTDDAEEKNSDPTEIPSSSHHKNHKHRSRKTAASPRKSKHRHAKSSAYQKSKSPPISIDKAKGFFSSREDVFLTPPNIPDEHTALGQKNSQDAEIQTSSSLMKSFTSSGTWNKSTEFLTPSTSFRDTSVSLENSVEIDETQGQVNFKSNELSVNPEYMTPFALEGDKIQKVFNNVKNEQKEMAKSKMEEELPAMDFSFGSKIDVEMSSQVVTKAVIEHNTMQKNAKNTSITDNEFLPEVLLPDITKIELCTSELKENKNRNEENPVSGKSTSMVEVQIEITSDVRNNAINNEFLKINNNSDGKELQDDNEKQQTSNVPDNPTSLLDEAKHDSNLIPHAEASYSKADENDVKVDLDSSVSSDESIVSLNSSTEMKKNSEVLESMKSTMTKESSSCQAIKANISESLEDKSTASHGGSILENTSPEILKKEELVASDSSNSEINEKEDKNVEIVSSENSR